VGFERTLTTEASFSDLEYSAEKSVLRRVRFLDEIEALTPWSAMVAEIVPFHSKREGWVRPPPCTVDAAHELSPIMLLFSVGIEDAIYDTQAIRRSSGAI